MAFSLPNYTDPATGAPVTYFVMTGLQLDLVNSQFTVFVNGYINQAAHTNGLAPIPDCQNMSFVISGATYQTFLDAVSVADLPSGSTQQAVLAELLSTLSTQMLTLPFFSGATIVS
jgi:hypothetical protein